MRRRLTIIAFVVVALSTSAFVFGKISDKNKHTFNKQAFARRAQVGSSPRTQTSPIPEHVTYGFYFSRVVAFQQRAAGASNPGASGQVIRTSVERDANLGDEQILAVNNIALACAQQLKQQDERAGQIIAAFRARYPERKVPPGESLPPPPSELKLLQEERNAIILRARNRLREALGEEVFNRLDEAVKRRNAVKAQGL